MFDGLVIMSGGNCTHPTQGPAIRLKHKKTYLTRVWPLVSCCAQFSLLYGSPFSYFYDSLLHLWLREFVHSRLYYGLLLFAASFALVFLYIVKGVTLPGTHAGLPALTRGKPSSVLVCSSCFFSVPSLCKLGRPVPVSPGRKLSLKLLEFSLRIHCSGRL